MPLGFFIRIKSAQHIHQSSVKSLCDPIALWVVGAGMSPCDSSQLAQLLDYCTLKISALICMESCWEPKSTEKILPQHLCHSDSLLVFCGVSLGKSREMIGYHQDILYPPLDFSRTRKSMQISSIGALVWMLTSGALFPAVESSSDNIFHTAHTRIYFIMHSWQKESFPEQI